MIKKRNHGVHSQAHLPVNDVMLHDVNNTMNEVTFNHTHVHFYPTTSVTAYAETKNYSLSPSQLSRQNYVDIDLIDYDTGIFPGVCAPLSASRITWKVVDWFT